MRETTIILLVATLFPIMDPLLLFYSMMGIAIGAGMLVEGEKTVFDLVSLSVCSASLYAVAQLFSVAKHFIKESASGR